VKKTALLMVASAAAQGSTPVLAGVNFQIGMGKDSALAKLAMAPNTRLYELGPDGYEAIAGKSEVWSGDVIFREDKLVRICLYLGGSPQTASSIAAALYAAVGRRETRQQCQMPGPPSIPSPIRQSRRCT
jgi:hypothetical protein